MATAPSPEFIFATFNAYQRTAALKGALELDLFTAVGEGARTADALAGRCRAAQRGMRILCDYLVVIGLLIKEGNQYGLTPDSATFLDRRSPAYIGDAVRFLTSPMLTDGFKDVAAAVRKGGTTASPEGTLEAEHPIWTEFARSMAPLMKPAAEAIAELIDAGGPPPRKVLDIAAGHGAFGLAIARRHASAKVVALDWPNVLTVAQENAQAAGVEERYSTLPGSAFEVDWGSGYDVVLLTNFLHHFDEAGCEEILRKSHRALNDGGRAVALEFVPNEDRVTPPAAAGFSLMMLGTTPSGDAYTFAEYDRMLRRAGFSRSELHVLPASPEQVVISFR